MSWQTASLDSPAEPPSRTAESHTTAYGSCSITRAGGGRGGRAAAAGKGYLPTGRAAAAAGPTTGRRSLGGAELASLAALPCTTHTSQPHATGRLLNSSCGDGQEKGATVSSPLGKRVQHGIRPEDIFVQRASRLCEDNRRRSTPTAIPYRGHTRLRTGHASTRHLCGPWSSRGYG